MSEGQRGWPAAPALGEAGGQRHWPVSGKPVEPLKPISRWIWWVGGGALVLLLAGGSWSGVKLWGAFQSSGKSLIVPLHQQMKAQDWDGILAAADPAFQEQVGKARSNELFQVVHDHMGDPVSYTVDSVNIATTPADGTTENLVLDTTFTKGRGVETLKYHKVNGVWRMTAYRCNSKLLNGVQFKTQRADGAKGEKVTAQENRRVGRDPVN